MTRSPRFNQRIVLLVDLTGTSVDHALFVSLSDQLGWAVLESHAGETGPGRGRVVRGRYVVEARVRSMYWLRRPAVDDVVEQVHFTCAELGIAAQVRVAALVQPPAGAGMTSWDVLKELPEPEPVDPSLPLGERVRGRLRNGRRRWARSGWVDSDDNWAGRLVTAASEQDALRLARRALPGVPAAAPGSVRVRDLGRLSPEDANRKARALGLVLPLGLLAMVFGARLYDLNCPRRGTDCLPVDGVFAARVVTDLGFVLALFTLVSLNVCFVRGLRRSWPHSYVLATGTWGLFTFAGYFFIPLRGAELFGWMLSGGTVFLGVLLLVRRWTWQSWVPWLLPVLLPFLLGLFPGLSMLVHSPYLGEFGFDLEDVEIPGLWQLSATLAVVATMSVWLVAAALWGYAREMQGRYAPARVVSKGMLAAFALVSFAVGPWNVYRDAELAAEDSSTTLAEGGQPAGYYGIEPGWFCVHPLEQVTQLPLVGGELLPSRAYVLLGDTGGAAALWDPQGEASLKVPLETIRIAPTHGTGRGLGCTKDGRPVEKREKEKKGEGKGKGKGVGAGPDPRR
ncbi:hypothetical protein ACH4SP_39595 [Streptomyces sp. NPDC021093]|uniref:hypothetical protein n=1 Tax=Streptomyces sp. NPDC021093 TaxID=3365112 RepID=UPI0037AC94C1